MVSSPISTALIAMSLITTSNDQYVGDFFLHVCDIIVSVIGGAECNVFCIHPAHSAQLNHVQSDSPPAAIDADQVDKEFEKRKGSCTFILVFRAFQAPKSGFKNDNRIPRIKKKQFLAFFIFGKKVFSKKGNFWKKFYYLSHYRYEACVLIVKHFDLTCGTLM